MKRQLAGFATLLALGAFSAGAQEHPNQARGFKADRAFSVGEVDQVNLFNGNLSLTIPIGQRYPVNSAFSYGLTLVYNSNLWKYEEDMNYPPGGEPVTATIARPDPIFNAGFGWTVHLGKLFPPSTNTYNDTQNWVYLSPDNSRHIFYPTLHEGEDDGSVNYWYTRDNTYLRLRFVQGEASRIEFPDGMTHTFGTSYNVQRIEDKFGNYLNVNTSSASQWTLQDSLGRTQTISFGGLTIEGTRQVSSIALTGFGGQSATYTFDYENATFYRTCKDTWWGNNAGMQPGGIDQITVPLLRTIYGPEGLVYKIQESPTVADYDRGAPLPPDYHFRDHECLKSGLIESLELPTHGKIAWTYKTWVFPKFTFTGVPGIFAAGNYLQHSEGVLTRTISGVGVEAGTWTYDSDRWPEPNSGMGLSREVRTKVTDPTGASTTHYFSAPSGFDEVGFKGWEYGLPFSAETVQDGLYLSRETFKNTNVMARRQWVSYSRDQLFGTVPNNNPDLWYDSNRRVAAEATTFIDDGSRVLTTSNFDFDGLGHYRASTRSGTFADGVSDTSTQRVQFNGSTCYEINLPTNQQTCTGGNAFTPPATSSPWVLNTYAYRQTNQSGLIARTFTTFESSTGFLSCERVVANGTQRGSNDVLRVFERDGSGNVTAETSYGGDLQALSTAAGCPTPSTFAYRTQHTYAYGVRSSSRAFRPTTPSPTAMPFYSYRADIDYWTGLEKEVYDTAGYATDVSWDLLGRLTLMTPASSNSSGEKGARTSYGYSFSGQASVTVLRDCPPNVACIGAPYGESQTLFDGFGRVLKERVRQANGSWSKRVMAYNALGWKKSVSELGSDGVGDGMLPGTQFQNFDTFGRPTRIRPADYTTANGHEINLSYAGNRVVARTVKVGTSAGSESSATTVETYDGLGRLVKVDEPAGPGGATVSTAYTYDVGHRLASVAQTSGSTTQNRSFNYDRRGFLISETHPEKGAAGNGTVSYANYDAHGHPRLKQDGSAARTVYYGYDSAERVTELRAGSSGGALLKRYTYDTGTGRGAGKLAVAEGYNYLLGVTALVQETYAYTGIEGRTSVKTTQLFVDGSPRERFDLGVSYDQAGNVTGMAYPQCSGGGCQGSPAAPLTVSFSYTNGFLTSVPDYASSLTYHVNGMLASVTHTNGVTDVIDVDSATLMQRPTRIRTTGVLGGLNFDTGSYSYDGAGNIRAIGANTYLYDKVSRLTSGDARLPSFGGGTASNQAYAFDSFGNISSITTTIGGSMTTVNTPTSSLTNRLNGANVTYDEAGNLTNSGGASPPDGTVYQYDLLNRMIQMTTPTGSAQEDWVYLYTADDERFWALKLNGLGSYWSLRDLSGTVIRQFEAHISWDRTKDMIYRDGQLLASVHPIDGVRHYHLDHLGTPRLATNSSGQMIEHHTYYPFGQELAGSTFDGERIKFTGHERDLNNFSGTGDDLDYMHARFCSPLTGRFLSVDPAGPDEHKPQGWNSYSYVLGNPLRYRDPSGLAPSPLQGYYYGEGVTYTYTFSSTGPDSIGVLAIGSFTQDHLRFLSDLRTGFGYLNVRRARAYYLAQYNASTSTLGLFFYDSLLDFLPESQGDLEFQIATTVLPPLRGPKLLAKLETIGAKATTSTGKQAASLLRKMAEKAGFTVVSGGKHLKVVDQAGKVVTVIPHSPAGSGTITKIVNQIMEALR